MIVYIECVNSIILYCLLCVNNIDVLFARINTMHILQCKQENVIYKHIIYDR